MSTPAEAPQGTPAITPTPAPVVPEAPAQETDWKAEARKWEERAKENKAAASRLAELDEASKSEAQKAAERLAAAEAKVADFEAREQRTAWADEITKGSHVPATALRGDTREALVEHFEQLKSLIPVSTPDDGLPHVPYRELSRVLGDAPVPSPGVGTLRAAYAETKPVRRS